MTRLWKWYENGISAQNVEKFVDDLKAANRINLDENRKVLPNQMKLHQGAISKSTSMLLSAALQNPQATDKVVSAALQMNIYLKKYYPTLESLNDERMMLPAMLEALEPHIEKYGKNHLLQAQAHHVVKTTKEALCQDVNNTIGHTVYSNFVEGYQGVMRQYTKKQHAPVGRKQSVIEI